MISRDPRAGRALRGIVLLVIAIAALVQLPMPFWGDQALFTYAAHGLRHGDRLYVDFWDYKQPGCRAREGDGDQRGHEDARDEGSRFKQSCQSAARCEEIPPTRVVGRELLSVCEVEIVC